MPVLKPKAKKLPVARKAQATSGKRVLPTKSAVGRIAKGVKVAPTTRRSTERNEWGITIGTDQDIVLREMIAGGADKHQVIERCNELFKGQTTSGGKPKPVSTVVNQLIHAMTARGFTVESTWRIVPPADGELKAVPRRSATKTAPESPSKGKVRPPVRKKIAPAAAGSRTGPRKLPIARKGKVVKASR